jgi:hypothetical protein
MDPSVTTVVFFVLFTMTVGWFAMLHVLFNDLKARHPQKYEDLGEPSLFKNDTFSASLRLLKFLYTREPEGLDDKSLLFQVNAMRLWHSAMGIGYVALLWLIISETAA